MAASGIGYKQFQTIFGTMNLPCMTQRNVKVREREVANPVMDVAKRTWHEALEKEVAETTESKVYLGSEGFFYNCDTMDSN